MRFKSFMLPMTITLACSALLVGCPDSRAFVDVSIQASQTTEAQVLEVDFEGMATAAPPFEIVLESSDVSEKLMGTEPVIPCPEDNSEAATIPVQVVEWFWDFGQCCGTATALGQNVTYTYPEPGCYVVTLVVTLSDGEMITTQEQLCL